MKALDSAHKFCRKMKNVDKKKPVDNATKKHVRNILRECMKEIQNNAGVIEEFLKFYPTENDLPKFKPLPVQTLD